MAAALGSERATVGMWEAGLSWPSARVLPDLAGLLCCSIDELYTAPESDTSSGAAAPPSPQEEGKGFFPQGEGKEEAG